MSDGFLARWTRRKRAVRAAEQEIRTAEREVPDAERGPGPEDAYPHPIDGSAEVAAAQEGPASAENAAAETAEPLPELPSLDTLSAESDLAPFLRAGVPTALRNAALRRMWSLDPAIRDFVSEAREYAYDWNTPGGVPGLGPLLPSDDVQAMLRRIVGGGPGECPAAASPAADTQEADAQEADAVAADIRAPGADDSRMDASGSVEADAPEADMQEAAGSAPLLAEAGPAAGAAPIPEASPPEAPPRGAEPVPAPEPASRPRLRRHGGAMPA